MVSEVLQFALNQVTVPRRNWRDVLNLAHETGCSGVEFRNDLGRPLFDGDSPDQVAQVARDLGLEVLGLSQVYPFNVWTGERAEEVRRLVAAAQQCGAPTINLIPLNAPPPWEEQPGDLVKVLADIQPLLQGSGVRALVEPLGFQRASLRLKADVVAAIEALGGTGALGIVHDTFHHFLSGEQTFFAGYTAMVHISGVTGPMTDEEFSDVDRVLVGNDDVLENIDQIRILLASGYDGPVSFECFSPSIQELDEPGELLRSSIRFIQKSLDAWGGAESN